MAKIKVSVQLRHDSQNDGDWRSLNNYVNINIIISGNSCAQHNNNNKKNQTAIGDYTKIINDDLRQKCYKNGTEFAFRELNDTDSLP